MTDTQIIDLLFERSEQGLRELAAKYGGSVGRIAFNILGSAQDAEECVNDTWLGVWNKIPPERPDPLCAYVCRIARNLATKRYHLNTALKRNSYYDAALDELAECLPDSGSIEEDYAARELGVCINRFLDTLSYEDRFLFMRRYWYGDTLPEIARMSGLSYGAVSVRLHRTKEKLRKELRKEGMPV